MKLASYAVLSTLALAATVGYAFYTRVQFYPAVVFLVMSKWCVLVLGNFALMMTFVLGRFVKFVFLGQLREPEVDLLMENSRYAITETCLALTIFREELTARVIALFSALLFMKIFHWLSRSRVELAEQIEQSFLTQLRLVLLLFSLIFIDFLGLGLCTVEYMSSGPSVILLFGFEYAILALCAVSAYARFFLHKVTERFENGWQVRTSLMMYIELLAESFRFALYMTFFCIIFTYYGIPIHIIRDVWLSFQNLRRKVVAVLTYRSMIANMKELFPVATDEDLEANHRECVICREGMEETWLQQRQICPTCRAPVPTNLREAEQIARERAQVQNTEEDTEEEQEFQADADREPEPEGQQAELEDSSREPTSDAKTTADAEPGSNLGMVGWNDGEPCLSTTSLTDVHNDSENVLGRHTEAIEAEVKAERAPETRRDPARAWDTDALRAINRERRQSKSEEAKSDAKQTSAGVLPADVREAQASFMRDIGIAPRAADHEVKEQEAQAPRPEPSEQKEAVRRLPSRESAERITAQPGSLQSPPQAAQQSPYMAGSTGFLSPNPFVLPMPMPMAMPMMPPFGTFTPSSNPVRSGDQANSADLRLPPMPSVPLPALASVPTGADVYEKTNVQTARIVRPIPPHSIIYALHRTTEENGDGRVLLQIADGFVLEELTQPWIPPIYSPIASPIGMVPFSPPPATEPERPVNATP